MISKPFKYTVLLLAALLLLACCNPVQEYFPVNNRKPLRSVSWDMGGNTSEAMTKISIDPNSPAGTTNLIWNVNDTVGVFGIPVDANDVESTDTTTWVMNMRYKVIEGAGTSHVMFQYDNKKSPKGASGWTIGQRYNVYAYYPYNQINDTITSVHRICFSVRMVQGSYYDSESNPSTINVGVSGFYYATDVGTPGSTTPDLTFKPLMPMIEFVFNAKTINSTYHGKDTTFVLFDENDQPVNPIYSIELGEKLPYDGMGRLSVSKGMVDLRPDGSEFGDTPVITEAFGRAQIAITAVDNNRNLTYFRWQSRAQMMVHTEAGSKVNNLALTIRLQNGEILEIKKDFERPQGGFRPGVKYIMTIPKNNDQGGMVTEINGATEQFDDITLIGKHRANTYIIPSPNGDASKAAHEYGFTTHVEGNSDVLTGNTIESILKNVSKYHFSDLMVGWPVVIFQEGYTVDGEFTNSVLDGPVGYLGIYFIVKLKQNISSARILLGALNAVEHKTSYEVSQHQDDYKPMGNWLIMAIPDAQYDAATQTYCTPTVDVNGMTFMDRNLGAFYPSTAATTSTDFSSNMEKYRGLTYQWGRFTPLRANNHTVYQYFQKYTETASCTYTNTTPSAPYNTPIFSSTAFVTGSTNTVAGGIKDIFYAMFGLKSGGSDWPGLFDHDSWVDPAGTTPDNSKSPVDPCPWGWRVPSAAQLIAAFPQREDSYTQSNNGIANGNLFLPPSGMYEIQNQSNQQINTQHLYWTSTTTGCGAGYAHNLWFSDSTPFIGASIGHYNNSSTGHSIMKRDIGAVRCIKFDEPETSSTSAYFNSIH